MQIYKIAGLGAASILIHGALLVSADHIGLIGAPSGIFQQNQRLRLQQKQRLEFEFVEAPKKAYAPPPSNKAGRISDHDALNQDASGNKKAPLSQAPAAKLQGYSDQLRQIRQTPGQLPQQQKPAIKPEEPKTETPKPEAKKLGPGKEESVPLKNQPASRQAQEAQAPVKGLSGQDKITTQEMSRLKSPGAQLFGTTSFEATGSGMGVYMKNLKEKIWLAWFPYLAFQYPQNFKGADAVVSLLIDADGDLKIVRVIDDGGDPDFAAYCVQAVQKASNFGPIPKEILAIIGKDELELKFGFHYR